MDKQHILDEIKRTADANNGVPLGRLRFEKATGIRESDWYGKYWRSWGDVVREAGYKSNELTQPYDEDFLLTTLAEVTRELGHYPIAADLRLRSRNDPDFPSDSVFFRRFGNKSECARKVIEYCEARCGFDDVVELCLAVPRPNDNNDTGTSMSDENFGYVYLLRSGKSCKIGFTRSLARRQYDLSIQLPEKPKLIHKIKTDDPVGIESYWHKRFAKKRKGGEWFELSSTDIAAFKRWKRIH